MMIDNYARTQVHTHQTPLHRFQVERGELTLSREETIIPKENAVQLRLLMTDIMRMAYRHDDNELMGAVKVLAAMTGLGK
jgi:hypothetical protein